ncbi:MAG: hypothetical protein ACREQ9_27285 [Candidatus Binatia bacterium]
MVAAAALVAAGAASCGGGGDGGGTIITGNVSSDQALLSPAPDRGSESRFAWLSPVGTAWAQPSGVEVCLAGSDICDVTDGSGSFTLPVDGDLVAPVCLEFTGSNFTADLCLNFDLPRGTVVRISNITCDAGDDSCRAEDVDVEETGEPSDVSNEPSDEDEPSEPSDPSPDEPSADDDASGPDEPSDG